MKHIIVLCLLLLITSVSKGQAPSLTIQPVIGTFAAGYSPGFQAHQRHGMGAVTIVGIVAIGVGGITTIAGWVTMQDGIQHGRTIDQASIDRGNRISLAGLIIMGAGTLMSIGGGIYDISQRSRSAWSLTSPQRNEIGLAYNFNR